MNNRFTVIIIACIAIFIGLVFFIKREANAPTSGETVSATNHVSGNNTTGVTLLEYGDFECPACGAYYPLVKEVKQKYAEQITFQFRNYPIVSSHPNAMSAHRAAEAASRQNKFWEMHDLLYERQSVWKGSNNPAAIFKGYAQELGLDMDRYNNDLVDSEVGTIIQEDIKAGREAGVNSTPTFFINGKKVEDMPRSVDDFSKLIDEAIAANKQ